MNILFLTLLDFESLEERNIYTDLLREFKKNNHKVYVISPTERRNHKPTELIQRNNDIILKLQIGNMQKTNVLEKGISTITLESKFVKGIKTYFHNVKFDLVLYSTPPITLQKAVEFIKKRDGALTYLLLKDIFPQNAVDIGILKTSGLKGLLYKQFRKKEEALYEVSDVIGCMSQANVDFIRKHNPQLASKTVEVCPNSIEVVEKAITEDYEIIKKQYNIPENKTTFIYGGNLGKPQGIGFLIECLKSNKDNTHVHFVIVGSGTEFSRLESAIREFDIKNVQLYSFLPKTQYEQLLSVCDVGLIFLDSQFTIPNFPSRLLSYMEASKPVLAATDKNTDIGQVIVNGKFGYWCESNNVEAFNQQLSMFTDEECRKRMGENAHQYLMEHYSVTNSYKIIMRHLKEGK